MVHETVTLEGHLIDSDVLRRALAWIVESGGRFEIAEFRAGRTNDAPSFARLVVAADQPAALDRILDGLSDLGATAKVEDARHAPAEAAGILPDDFYSSTSYATLVRVDGRWLEVKAQKMDCAVVLRDGGPVCVKQRLVAAGEPVVLRGGGIRVRPPERPRGPPVFGMGFGFMTNAVSAEVNKSVAIAGVAREMRRTRETGERIVFVTGPAVVHSGGDAALARLVRVGWVDVLLSGNAFAAHDLEKAIVGTSLGVCQRSGTAVDGGNRNHLFAINAVNRAGGIVQAVDSGLVKSGVMLEVVRRRVPFVLAGSIRDDGPLRDVITDALEAQTAYARALEGAGVCVLLATALHAIAVGNLLPASVRTVCVDMTEALPVKLANRGTLHAVGLVTDVGYFLEQLERELA